MGTASLHIDGLSLVWRSVWDRLGVRSPQARACAHRPSLWRRLSGGLPDILLDGSRYCLDHCLERALDESLVRVRSSGRRAAAPHRVPLGLLLLSRQQLTAEQLRVALEAQRNAGRGRIGEWLQSLGFATEQQVTAALARQWACPVLRSASTHSAIRNSPQIPFTLLDSFRMIPVDYVAATKTLHLAFGEGVDHNVLYAVASMTGCHTEACMAAPSFVNSTLQSRCSERGEQEVVFACVTDVPECSRIIRSYCARLGVCEIRIAGCRSHIWVRLLRAARLPLDLLFRSSQGHTASPNSTRT